MRSRFQVAVFGAPRDIEHGPCVHLNMPKYGTYIVGEINSVYVIFMFYNFEMSIPSCNK